jgi:hypothetical protein
MSFHVKSILNLLFPYKLQKSCATGYYSFGHEIAHMYGCHHNRETGATNPTYPTAFGYLMRPPVNSGYRTVMAYVTMLEVYI